MKYFGFALADSMFVGECSIERKPMTSEEVRAEISEYVPALNPSHVATINAMSNRFGMNIEIPATPPKVSLKSGDSIVVMGVRGLPRLTDRHEYTEDEIASATFEFSKYSVL